MEEKGDIRLLGGFRVRWGDRAVTGFESQKVRALLAYLVLNRHTAPSREQLASLLWPDEASGSSRKNLRQALYNLRTTLLRAAPEGLPDPLVTTHHSVQLNPEIPWRADVEEFEDTSRRACAGSGGGDPVALARAAELYRGDLLPSFYVRESVAFEDWLLGEQERFREMAVQVLRLLIDHHVHRGETRQAIGFARRLMEIDPLSEEAHRNLMRLYGMSGRRSAAIAQYQHLREILDQELGVEPLTETTLLYESLLAEELTPPEPEEESTPIPYVPLAGREEPLAQLARSWESARRGRARLVIVEGEAGIGKSRLARAAIREALQQRPATVLQGRGSGAGPLRPLQAIAEIVRNALAVNDRGPVAPLEALPAAVRGHLARLLGDADGAGAPAESWRQVASAVAELLATSHPALRGERRGDPLILLVEDLHWANTPTFDLLADLVDVFAESPLWVVVTRPTRQLGPRPPAVESIDGLLSLGAASVVSLDRLDEDAVAAVATSLVGDEDAPALTRFLAEEAGGLPLALSETVNALCDAGLQTPAGGERWRLAGELERAPVAGLSLDEVVEWRAQRLTTSISRLLAVAAVIGRRFDSALLQTAANEHGAVVETALGDLLDRWFIRFAAPNWEPERLRDRVIWSRGAHGGTFEFCHPRVREAIYTAVHPIRRRAIHLQVAGAMEGLGVRDDAALAHHYALAGAWQRALEPLQRVERRCRQLGCADLATLYRYRIQEAHRHLEAAEELRSGRERRPPRPAGAAVSLPMQRTS